MRYLKISLASTAFLFVIGLIGISQAGRIYLATVVYPAWEADYEGERELIWLRDARKANGHATPAWGVNKDNNLKITIHTPKWEAQHALITFKTAEPHS